MNKKNIILVVSIIAILASVIFTIYSLTHKKKPEDNTIIEGININHDKEIFKDTTVEGLLISNGSIVTSDEMSTYMAKVTNKTDSDYQLSTLKVIFTVNNETIETLALADTTIKANETKNIIINFDTDISKLTKVDYKVTKKLGSS